MNITFKPTTKQFQAWEYLNDTVTTELGYGGAAHGGKTLLGCFWIISMCLAYQDTAWLMGRKEIANLKKTTLMTFFKVCQEYGIEPEKHFNFNQQQNTITFTNGSIIFLLDLGNKPSDPLFTRLGGLEITGAFIDESNEIPIQAIEIIKTRIGRKNNEKYGLKPKILETFNPDKGHVYSRYYKLWRDGQLPPHRQFIQALPTDNPYTPANYIEQLQNSDKVTRERLLNGNFEYDDDPMILFNNDAISDLWTNTITKDGKKYITADIARFGSDRTVIGVWEGMEMIRLEMLQTTALDITSEKIRQLAQEYKVPFSQIIADEDGVGGGVVDMLKGIKGFIANSKPFEVWDTRLHRKVPENFRNLKTQCYFKLAEIVNNHKMALRVDDYNIREQIAEELRSVKQKHDNSDSKLAIISKDEMKVLLGRSPDIADMLMMRMYYEFSPQEVVDERQRVINIHFKRMQNAEDIAY